MDEYGCTARLYDPIVGPALRPIHTAIVDALLLAKVDCMVDLCCGTGMLAGIAASSGINTTGVDISRTMLDVARKKRPNATFIHGDATNLSFPDNTFNAATISFALHEKPQVLGVAIVTEARRVVRPGGCLIIADYLAPPADSAVWTGWIIRLVERIAGKEHHQLFHEYMAAGCMNEFFRHIGINGRLIRNNLNGWAGIYRVEC
ncbi:methyltransferase type 11 [Pseudodesulfovibrio nedwellii]|uniref:Methyltransferase type 11 n=1 Tax=Pseudodesulfovibrio nedwellii TaxID=2973072 RepID=A0ABM8B2Z7_9BACT|nr:methyltransferase domain-containing protein [Pseudodesulfovibrio nedwellii]BDQ38166.1 methyltransferase type 11 [Pseudodesulfovibrio nedwellii]